MYVRRNLPMDKEEISFLNGNTYLKPIPNEIVQGEDIVGGLLIGANCMKALEPMKIIPSKEDGPYAYKTLLGWCIVGPIINTETERSISCHQVAVKDVTSSRLAPHHFGVEKSIKDISLEEISRMIAFKKLMFLKRRFLKDQKFFGDYKKFMENLLVKGYTKQSEVVLSGNTWYIPHHGVDHSSKPGRIRVVFDCSDEFQRKSINR